MGLIAMLPTDRDLKFYLQVAILLFALAIAARLVIRFIGVYIEVPVLDPILNVIGHFAHSFMQNLHDMFAAPLKRYS